MITAIRESACSSVWDDEEAALQVEWVEPNYSKKRVNAAGRIIGMSFSDFTKTNSNVHDYIEAFDVVNNWRASHSFPLNTFQIGLRRKAQAVSGESVVAQRIKRLPSILHKLHRFPTMTLSQMQDIGGCRAILPFNDDVLHICDLYQQSSMKHDLHHIDNYVATPKQSGYRGVHLIYRYKSDRKATYNSLLIEMQLRSILQHAWATAVETVGLFVGQALKSSLGEGDWLDFFRLMGSGIAMLENTTLVPGTPDEPYDLARGISHYIKALDVFDRLENYSRALNVIEEQSEKRHHFFLIELDAVEQETLIRPFALGESEAASREYAETEKRFRERPGADVVLVSVDSFEQLRRAYPNYFADTRMFLDTIYEVLAIGGVDSNPRG